MLAGSIEVCAAGFVILQVGGGGLTEGNVVDVVTTVFTGVARGKDVAEGDVVAVARVGTEVDHMALRGGCVAAVVESCDGDKGRVVADIGEYTNLELVLGLGLADIEFHLESVDIGDDSGQGIEASFVEDEAVVAAMGA